MERLEAGGELSAESLRLNLLSRGGRKGFVSGAGGGGEFLGPLFVTGHVITLIYRHKKYTVR